MNSVKLDLPRGVLELHRFCADPRDFRSNIEPIKITSDSKTDKEGHRYYLAVATNGHLLGKYRWQALELDAPGDFEFYLPGTIAKQALKGWTKARPGPVILHVEDPENQRTGRLECQHTGASYEIAQQFVTFPDWRQVWPDDVTPGATPVGADLCYMSDFADYLKRVYESGGAKITMRGELEPMIIERESNRADLGEFGGILMPMRI